ncbi:hypothetical protein KAR91_08965, partial [Candidatus Pacearchaeota archaeon]|nr:hypothetical protein [Candidatus Pacearchaeota archaeon]
GEIFVVSSWGKFPKSENHKLKWDIVNKEGKNVYTNSNENVTIHPYMYISQPIRIDRITKDDIQAGMYTVNFYFDDKLVKSQNVQYVPESIINKNIQGAVILPFSNKSLETAFAGSRNELLSNTISFAIYSEVKRIIPYTVPHFVAQQNLRTLLRTDCFNNKDCMNWIEDKFDEEIFITGNIELAKYEDDLFSITVYVYHTKTKTIKKFDYSESGAKERYDRIIQALLKGVMYKEGLLDYLKSM